LHHGHKKNYRPTNNLAGGPGESFANVPKTHRYMVTKKGRRIITALLAARQASTGKLTDLAA